MLEKINTGVKSLNEGNFFNVNMVKLRIAKNHKSWREKTPKLIYTKFLQFLEAYVIFELARSYLLNAQEKYYRLIT